MSKIWYCSNCGYEVEAKGRCHLCRHKLIASPLPPLPAGDEDGEVGYRIADWEDRARGRLIEAMVAEGIVHRFEDDDLVVGVADEERVDGLVEELAEAAGDGAPDDASPAYAGPVEGEVVLAVEMLAAAARRLRVDPTDMEADGDVAEASAGVFMTEGYPGLDADEWAAVGRVTRRLLAALGSDDALEDEISRQAAVLVTLLRPAMAAPTDEAAPAEEAESEGSVGREDSVRREDSVGREDEEGARAAAAVFGGAGAGGALQAAENPELADEDGPEIPEVADEDGAEPSGIADEVAGDPGDEPRLLGGGPETSYEVPEWLPEQRALLSVLLEERAIPHAWDGADLVVPSVDEGAVEALFDQVGGVAADDDDETRYRALEELFAAVNRLAGDPDDKERMADVVANSGAVEGPTPLGYDDGKWLALRRRTRTLADALEHAADPDVVASQAVSLRDALRELV